MRTRGWVSGLVVIAVTVVGCSTDGGGESAETSTSTVTSTSTAAAPPPGPSVSSEPALPPGVPAPVLAPFLLTVNGPNVSVMGDVPEQATRTAVLDAITAAVGPDAAIGDTMQVNPGSTDIDAAQLTAVLNAAKPVAYFGLRRDPDAVTLTGSAENDAAKNAVGDAARALFPGLTLRNDIVINPPTP